MMALMNTSGNPHPFNVSVALTPFGSNWAVGSFDACSLPIPNVDWSNKPEAAPLPEGAVSEPAPVEPPVVELLELAVLEVELALELLELAVLELELALGLLELAVFELELALELLELAALELELALELLELAVLELLAELLFSPITGFACGSLAIIASFM